MREWKTLNVVSALLLSAIVTVFQIDDAANNLTTRTTAFISLGAALFALLYGCTFILRFGTMKRMDRASNWAQEAHRTQTDIFWNIWVLLATAGNMAGVVCHLLLHYDPCVSLDERHNECA